MPSIPQILRQHFSEYSELLPIYRSLFADDECTEDDLRAWQDRLAAHLDGLLVDPQAAGALVEEAFDSGQGIAAATDVALRLNSAAGTAKALQFLESCQEPEQAVEVIVSLCQGNADLATCADAAGSANEVAAAAAMEAVTRRGSRPVAVESLRRLFHSQSPSVRESTWRIAGDLSLPG